MSDIYESFILRTRPRRPPGHEVGLWKFSAAARCRFAQIRRLMDARLGATDGIVAVFEEQLALDRTFIGLIGRRWAHRIADRAMRRRGHEHGG